MIGTGTIHRDLDIDVAIEIAAHYTLDPAAVRPYGDFTELLTALLAPHSGSCRTLLVAGHATPDVAIAADSAGLTVKECFGASPFTSDLDAVIARLNDGAGIVYLANPNRVTGSVCSSADLEMLADAITDGRLIIDEQYTDYYGHTATALALAHPQVIVIRSFTAAVGMNSSECGFMVGQPSTLRGHDDHAHAFRFPASLRKWMLTALHGMDELAERVNGVHAESLRVAEALHRLGATCRLSPTDFVLLRVADPVRVGNALVSNRVLIENLDGYPHLEKYLRYRLQSRQVNDAMLRAFSRLPKEYYQLRDLDRRRTTLRSGPEDSRTPLPVAAADITEPIERLEVYTAS